ncbi:hypothetical protein D0N36_14300 [Hymenobacter lapidiphilus]|uniref:cupin domain-containing protein n=1 Tax=Hymenobacter sp. CCM 8763 TaxID=2303334 RepID=UPI000E3574D7|nr:cupin domain-containing protein [Hymenobacter sp. CCM 8763]RFP64357.1 hypothetical protein D0N36_14300 [Hymenobacter sp. CCM 8763]
MHLAYSAAAATSSAETLQLCTGADLQAGLQQRVRAALSQGIEALEATVTELLATTGQGRGSCPVLASIIGELCQPDTLRLLLAQLLASEPALTGVQDRSYYHHNGFRKLVLLQNAAFKLRLHLWEANSERHHENIHDHRWNFASCLLAGRFQTVVWEEDPTGPETRLDCTYTPAQGNGHYGVRENGQVRLRQRATHQLQAGDLYYMPASTLHQVTDPGQGETITLMLTATPVLDHCKLYAEHSIPEQDKQNVPFSRAEIQHELRALLRTTCQPALAA